MTSDAFRSDRPEGVQLISGLAAHDALGPVMQVMQQGFDPSYGEAWNHSQTRSMLSLPLSHTIIAETIPIDDDAGSPIGFAMSRRVADEEELLLIAVVPTWRRRCIGSVLLDQVIDNAKIVGVSKLFLEMRSNNPAIHFYRQFGFSQVGLRKDYYTGSDSQRYDALTMVKLLKT